MMDECSPGELLAVFMPHNDKGHNALKHFAAHKGLIYQTGGHAGPDRDSQVVPVCGRPGTRGMKPWTRHGENCTKLIKHGTRIKKS